MPYTTSLLRKMRAMRGEAVLWLALVALALRALVPAGYMPDTRALHDGRLAVTFCSAAGDLSVRRLALSFDGSKTDHDTAGTGAQCPFALLAHVAPVPAPALTTLLLTAAAHPPHVSVYRALPVQPAQGPPLGSRAPPLLA